MENVHDLRAARKTASGSTIVIREHVDETRREGGGNADCPSFPTLDVNDEKAVVGRRAWSRAS